MSVSGISSSIFMNQNTANIQNQQRLQQQFQQLAQQFQNGDLSPAQTSSLTQNGLPTISAAAESQSSSLQSDTSTGREHWHHRMHIRAGSDPEQQGTNPLSTNPGQTQPGSASTAQQAYGSLTQDLQQIALNSDLLTAQNGTLESTGLSLMV